MSLKKQIKARYELAGRSRHPNRVAALLECDHIAIVKREAVVVANCYHCQEIERAKKVHQRAFGPQPTFTLDDVAKMIKQAVAEAAIPKPKQRNHMAGVHLLNEAKGEDVGLCGFRGDTDPNLQFVTCTRCKDLYEFSRLSPEAKAKGFAAWRASRGAN